MRWLVPLVLLAAPANALADGGPTPVPGETRPIVLVGNNWAGTTDVLDPFTFERLDRINVVPDKEAREAEIMLNPDREAFFLAIRQEVGEGHDQFNDDVFSSHDGRTIYVSRPSFADVVAIDLATKKIVWRTPVAGYRADHMAISPDGTKLLVSASTANVVDQIDTATGKITGQFPSGDSPHESNYSADGKLIYHASIGRVYTPTDDPPNNPSKGDAHFEIVDGQTLQVIKTIDMAKKLEEAGHPNMSSAVRPMALAPDEKTLYFQVSFFHGFVEYDLVADKVTRVANLPVSEKASKLQREDYLLDSAHHGLAINREGTKLCVAGTMSDYGAIVDRKTFAPTILDAGTKPYWATNSADGEYCYISASGDDSLSVLSYRSEKIIAKVPVGDHPQRVRNGVARLDIYPGGPYGEAFKFGLFHERSPIGIRGGNELFGCRAVGAQALRLTRCLVELRTHTGGKRRSFRVGIGERAVPDQRSFKVNVELTKTGKRLLRRHPRGLRVDLLAEGSDSIGRIRVARGQATIKRGT
jgi:YVTN family beta-propeller protein